MEHQDAEYDSIADFRVTVSGEEDDDRLVADDVAAAGSTSYADSTSSAVQSVGSTKQGVWEYCGCRRTPQHLASPRWHD